MKVFLFILLWAPAFLSAAAQANNEVPDAGNAAVTAFYKRMSGQLGWLNEAGRNNLELLEGYLLQAKLLGLDTKSNEVAYIRAAIRGSLKIPGAADSFAVDMRITETAIQFFREVAYGNLAVPPVKYAGLPAVPDSSAAIAVQLADSLLAGNFTLFLQAVEPADEAYNAVKKRLAAVILVLSDSTFKEIPITSLKADTSNTPLLIRLRQTDPADTVTVMYGPALQEKIRKAQARFNNLDDGVLRSRFLHALNIPLAWRAKELSNALNQLRWLRSYKAYTKMVVVNIPSTNLVLYQDGRVVLDSRVITGKKSTPTPTLCSRIKAVVLFPYWTVPHRIATRELLPRIKMDRNYLTDNQFEILDKKGRMVDPALISWNKLNSSNFPYVIRQNTGCDNSLGIVKLDFFSPFSVYLHDTPGKNLFMLHQRFFSHGCVRVEDAVALAHMLLDDRAADMKALEEKGPRPDQQPVVFPVQAFVPVFILYNTAWPDAKGEVKFYEDVYGKN